MAVMIDPVAKKISLNVRDLAADSGFARIGFGREGWGSFAVGAKVHECVLAARMAADPVYRKEIHLEAALPIDDWTAVITGRIDGCRVENSAAHIEEFKTASLIPGRSPRNGPGFERHCRQLLIYCDLWTRRGERVASARVVYVDPDTAREEIIEVEFEPARQAAETERRLRRLLNEWKAKAEARSRKSLFADTLPFPHDLPRAGQPELMTAIRDSLETGGHLLAEAPTGSGKTAASIYSALQHGLRTGRQLVFLTSKTMQQTMAVRALEAMNRDGTFRTVQLRAKEKMCAHDRVFCHEDVCPYARNYPVKMARAGLLNQLENAAQLSPEKIFNAAKAEQVCPFEVQLELARTADVIVADYNYVFDPGSALMHLRDEGLRAAILVIDEAHNLPDRIRAIFSPALIESNVASALDAVHKLGNAGGVCSGDQKKSRRLSQQLDFSASFTETAVPFPQMRAALEQALSLMGQLAAQALADKDGTAEIAAPRENVMKLWEQWKPAFHAYAAWKQNDKLFLENDPVVEFHFALQRFVGVLRLGSDRSGGFTCLLERRNSALRLAMLCLEPAIPAAPILRPASSAIFLSATLQPFELFRQTMGLEKSRVSEIALSSPFPPENRRVLIVPQVRTNFSVREKNLPVIASLIAEIDAAHDGNKLVLLPSYDFLRRLAENMSVMCRKNSATDVRPLIGRLERQSPAATDKERQALLKKLAAPPPGGILLFAVLGGMFAEGVDYPGELLETVVVVSPGLPQLSFERELLRRHFDERAGNGFEYAYLQPGMTRVIQAAGRLIRTETDRGVIALICGRFLEEPYSERLPRDWYQHSPRELISENPARAIREFFSAKTSRT